MACIYPKRKSPFWWIEYLDAAGERRQESTKLRRDVTTETRKARALRDEMQRREYARGHAASDGEAWDVWVPRFLLQRYAGATATLTRYQNSWRNVSAFLRLQQILVPRQLQRQQIRDFVEWRIAGDRANGIYKAAKNTALHEIKLLRILMNEAVESGFAATNPCLKLGIRPDEPERKPKITEVEHRLITRSLKREKEWMRISYKIAWEQGCRFSETCLELDNVDLARNVIGFRTKGQKKRIAEVPLSPKLRPLFRRLIKIGRKTTFQMPAMPSKAWWQFFRRIGLPHLCFHCTRVSFVTRCYEAGLSQELTMRLVLHASTTAHQVYPRLDAPNRLLQEAMAQL